MRRNLFEVKEDGAWAIIHARQKGLSVVVKCLGIVRSGWTDEGQEQAMLVAQAEGLPNVRKKLKWEKYFSGENDLSFTANAGREYITIQRVVEYEPRA